MLLTDPEYRAHCVHRAVKGLGTDEMVLIDVILTCSNEQVRQMKTAYQHHFLIPMQLRVDLDTSGKFQGVLDAVLNCKRPESGVDMNAVQGDLEVMFNATEAKIGTDEKAILNLVATRSREHLWYLNNAYKTRSPHQRTFTEELKCEISGIFWLQKALVAVRGAFFWSYSCVSPSRAGVPGPGQLARLAPAHGDARPRNGLQGAHALHSGTVLFVLLAAARCDGSLTVMCVCDCRCLVSPNSRPRRAS